LRKVVVPSHAIFYNVPKEALRSFFRLGGSAIGDDAFGSLPADWMWPWMVGGCVLEV